MTAQPLPPAYAPAARQPRSYKVILYRRKSTFVFVTLFIVLLVVPWAILNVLNIRPVGGNGKLSSWQVVDGTIGEALLTSERCYRAAIALNTAAAVLTIPILSAVLNHAAVILVQRRHHNQHLSAQELLSLADAPWSRFPEWGQLRSALSYQSTPRRFVFVALALVVIGFSQPILQSALVTSEQIHVATILDVPGAKYNYWHNYGDQQERSRLLGYDAHPNAISVLPSSLVSREVAARLSAESEGGVQPRLWLDGPANNSLWDEQLVAYDHSWLGYRTIHNNSGGNIFSFASAFPSGIDTGVLRYHALRLNSSAHCESVPRVSFPETCPGSRPFNGSVLLPGDSGGPDDSISIQWCVPGAYDISPWPSNRNRQEIAEELFMDMSISNENGGLDSVLYQPSPLSFTIHCIANSTRGVFELPNHYNHFQAGSLLDSWPSNDELLLTSNDASDNTATVPFNNRHQWSYSSPNENDSFDHDTPGPLTMAMISMLGNESWIYPIQNISLISDDINAYTILRDMCDSGIPLLTWDAEWRTEGFSAAESACYPPYYTPGGSLEQIKIQTFAWFRAFNQSGYIDETLSAAMFLANEATLTRAANDRHGEAIYSAKGTTITKPNISRSAQIVVSIFLGAEVLALVSLLVFIYRTRTFTTRLDAFTVATIGAQLSASGALLPHLGENDRESRKYLQERDGLIGFSTGSADGLVNETGDVVNGVAWPPSIELDNIERQDSTAAMQQSESPHKMIIVGGASILSQSSSRGKSPR
ncbi:hypothetical protein F5Y19DRAFT_46952 [Xylariaceae sp. FL1651]|nr:hypothetical protein F5Y19DRAFT_46952 [Xylariaceae sp. FL1651]